MGVTLVLGAARSGKSRYAEELIAQLPAPWTYIATATARDEDMHERIAQHRARRDGRWQTLETPADLAEAIVSAQGAVLVDCLTLWLSELMLGGADLAAAFDALEQALARARPPVILVSSEVGWGIVPDNALARRFRDEAGRLHQRLAGRAERVVLVVAGLPMVVK